MLGDKENYVFKATKKFIEFSHRINLKINENKIKYLIITQRSVNKTALKVVTFLNKRMDLNTLESTKTQKLICIMK